MAIAFVGQGGNTASNVAASTGLTVTYSSTAGNFLVLAVSWVQKGVAGITSGTSVTDSSGTNTWSLGDSFFIFAVANAAAITSVTVLANGTGSSWYGAASVMEFSGVSATIDVTGGTSGTSTAPTGSAGTTTNANDLASAMIGWGDGLTGTAPTISGQTAGWTIGTLRSVAVGGGTKVNVSVQQAYEILAATTSVSYSATLSASEAWETDIFTYEGSAAARLPRPLSTVLQAVNRSAVI